ncbi:SH3 domain-containing protein [Sphingomonas jeddahensis]|uniref:Bacterial dipeptidyl-peptidase SH3 domain-containing protein n=1 Tax=Sphingomonas jeddahensis TaxID=1915074 RepID=A0A1V2EUV0_9SPHN|nr:SH3 domain-containing protein [Sphingomonas jeddahensis]ONF95949.1 hypothetical protein SPHI_18760 [Sphingomonas jeddahensis]
MSSPSQPAPARKSFALLGRSHSLDPTRHAVRKDLADVRLADQVFAPHYAAPLRRQILATTELRAERTSDSPRLAILAAGDPFDMLDVTGDTAWGVATVTGLVGYVDAAALGDVA